MSNYQLIRKWLVIAVLAGITVTGIWNCKPEALTLNTTTDVNMTGYFEGHPEQFSQFLQILELTGNAGFLNAYGAYTCFAPLNAAVQQYLQEKGKTSIEQVALDELKDLVKFHLVRDTLSTRSFTDGKLPVPTMFGQYLITGADNKDGVTRYTVNRQASVIKPNIVVGNGIIHAIDHVLQPARLTIAQMMEQDARYSIFTQALKATGFYDTLNIVANPDTSRRWLTLIAETDEAFQNSGIHSYAALKQRYNNTGNPANRHDSLYLFMAYRIIPDLRFLADIVTYPSHPTLAPFEVLTSKLKGEAVLLNDDAFNGVEEPGIPLDRATSDHAAVNGVIHNATGTISIKVRKPVPVYWDVADQPELRKMTGIFRKAGKYVDLEIGQLANVTWQMGTIRYTVEAPTTSQFYYWDDKFQVALRTANQTNSWIEFTTPMLVKGRYKIWICFRRDGGGKLAQVFLDGELLPRLVNFTEYMPVSGKTPEELEAEGWKIYSGAPASNTTQGSRLAGVIDIKTTDRHKLKLQAIADSRTNIQLDMVHFIPVEADQLWPRFARDGAQLPKP